ncbi:MAG: sulfotransferase [Alphaproteobacteria bacterium]|nr:sulfotransferase [Alphaproteobacteria bacterium]
MHLGNLLRSLAGSSTNHPKLAGKTFVIGLGAAKAGTSWMFQYFQKHPQIICSPLKEFHYFDVKFGVQTDFHQTRAFNRVLEHINRDGEFIHRLQKRPHFQASIDRLRMMYSEDAYFEHFSRISEENVEFLCEITPQYQVLPEEGFRYIQELFSKHRIKVKFVLLLRDPVDRFWSHCRFLHGRDPAFDPVKDFHEHFEGPTITNRSDYDVAIQTFLKVFPRDQIYIDYYETMFDRESVQSLCNFIGINYVETDFASRRNETSVDLDLGSERGKILFDRFENVYGFCADFLDKELPQKWKETIEKYGA